MQVTSESNHVVWKSNLVLFLDLSFCISPVYCHVNVYVTHERHLLILCELYPIGSMSPCMVYLPPFG